MGVARDVRVRCIELLGVGPAALPLAHKTSGTHLSCATQPCLPRSPGSVQGITQPPLAQNQSGEAHRVRMGRGGRMSKDYERLMETSECVVLACMTRLMLARLTRDAA